MLRKAIALTGKATARMVASIAHTRLSIQRQAKTPMKRHPYVGGLSGSRFSLIGIVEFVIYETTLGPPSL